MNPILLVEDDKAILEAMELVLEAYGYQVSCAKDGREALQMLKTDPTHPSLILLDKMMPVMDGVEFLNERKKDQKLSEIPVLILSAAGDIGLGIPDGTVAGYIKKPVDINTLIDTIEGTLQDKK